MARFSIKDSVTGLSKYEGTPRYSGAYCRVSCLEFSEISLPQTVSWKVGDYVDYTRTGMRYKLYDIPAVKRQSYTSKYGAAFVYQNVQFFPDTKQLELEPFRDLVTADNRIHFTTQASWSVYGSAYDIMLRMQAVMDEAYPGLWEFRMSIERDATGHDDLRKLLYDNEFNFTINGESVLDGLNKLYDLCGNVGWIHTVEDGVNVITIGIPSIMEQGVGVTTEEYAYGRGNGLTELKKNITNRNELKTRLYAYGSTRNMIARYYNNLSPAIKDNDSVYIPNLMLPLSEWGTTDGQKDASKAFLENNVSKYGLRPATVYFDGSDGLKDIYPSLEETTIGQLKAVMSPTDPYYPTGRADSVRLDEVLVGSDLDDDGIYSETGAKYAQSQDVVVSSHSESYAGSIEYDILTFVAAASGKLHINLYDLAVQIAHSSALSRVSANIQVTAGENVYVYGVEHTDASGVLTITLPTSLDPAPVCNAGDTVKVTLFFSNSTESAVTLSVTGATITANYSTNLEPTFTILIPQIGFNIADRSATASQGIATIAFTDGKCGGRSFSVKSTRFVSRSNAWELTLYRGKDDSLAMLFPNSDYQIEDGDHYVLLDILMPDIYVGMAEQRLLAEAEKLLAEISEPKPFYEPAIDAKFMVEEERVLMEGWYMQLADGELIGEDNAFVLIDTLAIAEGESPIPTYRVTLREQKKVSYSSSQSVQTGNLQSLAGGNASSGSQPTGSGLTEQQRELLANLDSWFGFDSTYNAVFVKKDSDGNARSFYAFGGVTAGGVGSGGGGGSTLTSVTYANALLLTSEDVAVVPSAYSVAKLGERISELESRPSGGVTAFNGRTGSVTLLNTDITTALGFTPADASDLATVATSGSYNDLTNKPESLKNPYALTFGNNSYDGSAAKTITAASLGAYLTTGGLISSSTNRLVLLRNTLGNHIAIAFRNQNNNADIGAIEYSDTYYGMHLICNDTSGNLKGMVGIDNSGMLYHIADDSHNKYEILDTKNFVPGVHYVTPGAIKTFNAERNVSSTEDIDDIYDGSGEDYLGLAKLYAFVGTDFSVAEQYRTAGLHGFPTKNNANALLSLTTYKDPTVTAVHQLGFSGDGNIYRRTTDDSYSFEGVTWRKVWDSGNSNMATVDWECLNLVARESVTIWNGAYSVKLEVDAQGNFKVNGNIIATGAVTAGA